MLFTGFGITIGFVITLITMVIMQAVTNTIMTTSILSLVISAAVINFVSVWFMNVFARKGIFGVISIIFPLVVLYFVWDMYVLEVVVGYIESLYNLVMNVFGLQVAEYTQLIKIALPSMLFYFVQVAINAYNITKEQMGEKH